MSVDLWECRVKFAAGRLLRRPLSDSAWAVSEWQKYSMMACLFWLHLSSARSLPTLAVAAAQRSSWNSPFITANASTFPALARAGYPLHPPTFSSLRACAFVVERRSIGPRLLCSLRSCPSGDPIIHVSLCCLAQFWSGDTLRTADLQFIGACLGPESETPQNRTL